MVKQIEDDFKQALKDKNEIATSALRNLKAEMKNVAIEKRRELNEDEVLEVVRRKVKQHKDSIEGFTAGNRPDLVQREQQQMGVLLKYMPKQMAQDDVRKLVEQVAGELNASSKDFGRVMKEVLTRAKGQTDGAVVSQIVKEVLK